MSKFYIRHLFFIEVS